MKLLRFVLLTLGISLIAARIALPYILLHFAEYKLNQIPGYHAAIGDIDVSLLAGKYTIKDIRLVKIKKHIPVPFFSAEKIDLAVEWRAIFHASFVAKAIATKPTLNFVIDPKGNNEQLTIDKQWEKIASSLFPLNFNRIDILDGEVNYRSYTSKPPFRLMLKTVNFTITNLQNVERKKAGLLSNFIGSGVSKAGANVKINGKYDPFAKSPTFYLTISLVNMPITEAKNFLRHYSSANVVRGNFSLYIEAAAAEGKITGYAKPFVKNLKISSPKNSNPIEALYNGALNILAKIVTNPKQKTVATEIKFSGNIEDPDTSILSILGYLISHAFIQSLIPQIDHNVKMQDIVYPPRH